MAASHGAHCPRVLCVPSYRRFWVTPLPSMPRRFGRTVMVFRAIPSPVFRLEKPGSSSRGLGSPPEFVVPTSARTSSSQLPTPCDVRAPSLGSPSSSRRQSSESTYRRASQARLRSARSVSRALGGLLLAVPCRLVSSCCHVQDSRSRGFLPRLSRTTSSVARPSAPLAPSACRQLPDDASSLRVNLEVLIRVEIRSIRGLFRPSRHPRPLMRFAPSGFAPPVLEASLPPPPLGL
jgi:hypothetical protein